MSEVCVVHLVWAPLGLEPFRRFLESYEQHPSGLRHRLLLVFNGFSPPADLTEYQRVCMETAHDSLILPKPLQDVAAYFSAARASAADDLCFLNSYSVIGHDDWLAKLHGHLHGHGIGLVGATGSWESMYSALLRQNASRQRRWTPRGLRAALLQRLALGRARRSFAPFPNPHLRTNAFMIGRARLLSLGFPEVCTKDEAHQFESGRGGLTWRMKLAGWTSRVVDCTGRAWPPEEWPLSQTFRSARQENLLIADNRTRDYEQADQETRRLLTHLAWGAPQPAQLPADA